MILNQARKKYTLETDENGNTYYKIVDCDPCAPIQLIDCDPCAPMKIQDCDPCGTLMKANPNPPQILFNPCPPQVLPQPSQLCGGKEFFDFQMQKVKAGAPPTVEPSNAVRQYAGGRKAILVVNAGTGASGAAGVAERDANLKNLYRLRTNYRANSLFEVLVFPCHQFGFDTN